MPLGVSPWIYPVWDCLGFLDLGYFLPHFREVFNYYLIKYFLMSFLFVFFWNSYDLNVGAFNIVPEVSEVVLISFNSFFVFSSLSFISTILSSTSHISLLPLLFYCWFPPEYFWSQLLHYSLLINSFLFLLGQVYHFFMFNFLCSFYFSSILCLLYFFGHICSCLDTCYSFLRQFVFSLISFFNLVNFHFISSWVFVFPFLFWMSKFVIYGVH